jgi:hypothetical protein
MFSFALADFVILIRESPREIDSTVRQSRNQPEHGNPPRAPGSKTGQIRGGLDLEILRFGGLLW